MLRPHLRLAVVLSLLGSLSASAAQSDRFARVEAFLQKHCVECHGVKAKKADLVLNVYHDEPSLLQDRKVWERALEQVREGEMPPTKRPQPSETELAGFVHGVEAIFDE